MIYLFSLILSCLGKVNFGPTCFAVLLTAYVDLSMSYEAGPGIYAAYSVFNKAPILNFYDIVIPFLSEL